MKLIEKALQHFQSIEPRELHVPEWEVTVYAKEPTLGQKSSWMAKSNGDNTDFMLNAICEGALDKDGQPLFDVGDKPTLRRIGSTITERVGLFVLNASAETDEEREKN